MMKVNVVSDRKRVLSEPPHRRLIIWRHKDQLFDLPMPYIHYHVQEYGKWWTLTEVRMSATEESKQVPLCLPNISPHSAIPCMTRNGAEDIYGLLAHFWEGAHNGEVVPWGDVATTAGLMWRVLAREAGVSIRSYYKVFPYWESLSVEDFIQKIKTHIK